MKRLLILIVSVILAFSLIACGSDNNKYNVEIISDAITSDAIDVKVVIKEKVTSLDLLKEVASGVATKTYQKYFETIELDYYTLTIYFYKESDNTNTLNSSYGKATYIINQDFEHPGLNAGSFQLKLG